MLRSQIDLPYRQQAAMLAAKHFVESTVFQRSQHIACYLHAKHELDTSFLVQAIWQANKICYLPILSDKAQGILTFVRYDEGDALRLNRHAIWEPVDTATEMAAQDLAVVITPLVAFDLAGHRLGTGGGYYDKTFAFLGEGRPKHLGKRPCLIGFAYAMQQAASLPVDPWDIILDGVVTEKGAVHLQCFDLV